MSAGRREGKFSEYAQRSKLLDRLALLRFLSVLTSKDQSA